MNLIPKVLLFLLSMSVIRQEGNAQGKRIKHFIYYGPDRENIRSDSALALPNVAGAQIRYMWRQLEPAKGEYDFSAIEEDLKFLQGKGKKLFIQVQDVTWAPRPPVPDYLLKDSAYHGGHEKAWVVADDGSEKWHGGYVTRRWDPAVNERFCRLIQKLAEQFDGRIEGINLAETSIDVSIKNPPQGYDDKIYLDALKKYMKALGSSFKRSAAIMYANFMPGGVEYLRELYTYAQEVKVGMGGPDIKVYKKFQMINSYPLIRQLDGMVPTGVAVQDGDYTIVNERTNKRADVPEIYSFAKEYLKLDYVFWCTEEPYYSKELLPFLKEMKN